MIEPSKMFAAINNLAKSDPEKDEYEIISEIIANFAGTDPDAVLVAIDKHGGTRELVEAMADEVKRARGKDSRL